MTRPRSRLRRVSSALARGLAAAFVLVLVLVLAGSLYLSTAPGKARLLGTILAQLNQVLPGKVSVQTLRELRPSLVVLEGIHITAPAGNEVLAVPRLRVRLDVWSLLREQIVVPELALEVENADVRVPMEPGTGLVSAFVTLDGAPDSEESSFELSDLPKLQVTVLHLEAKRIGLPEAPVGGPIELHQVALDSKVTLGPRLGVELERLDGQVWRHGAELGHLSTRGQGHTEQPSTLDLESSLCGMDLALDLDGHFPQTKDWLDTSFEARLELRELSTARLATLLELPEIAATPVGPIGADLRLRGTLRHIELSGTLLSAGGNATISATALELADLDQAHLDLVLDAERLRLRPILESLPDWQLTTKSAVALSWPKASPGLHLAARSESALDGTPLPLVTLQADIADGGIHATSLRVEQGLTSLTASGGWSAQGRAHLRLAGHLDLKDARQLAGSMGSALPSAAGQVAVEIELDRDSEGRLDARGSLASRRLRIESAQLEQLDARFFVAGKLPLPELRLDATWAAVRNASFSLTPGRLQINGKPNRYAFDLKSGALPLGSVAASGWFEPGATRSRVALEASGTWRDAPWKLDVEPVEILPDGTLRVPGAELVLAAQRAKLSGTYSPTSTELGLDFTDVDLAQVLAPFGVAPGLRGTSSGHLVARGTLERPSLQLELRGARLGLENAPTLDARLSATLDVGAGSFELDSQVCESPESAKGRARLQFSVHAGSQFDKRAAWPASWRDGEHGATLTLQRVEHRIVGELLGAPLPVDFDLEGALSVAVRHGMPELHWKGSGQVAPNSPALGGSEQTLSEQVAHELDYHDGQIETALRVKDREGTWLTLQARAEPLPGRTRQPRISELLEQARVPLAELLENAAWDVEVAAEPRSLARWPLPASVMYLSDAKLAAAFSAHGHPLREPQGKLQFNLSGVPTQDDATICVTRDWRIGGQLDFEDGDFRAAVSGYHGQEQLLQVNTGGRFALLPRLRGEAPPPPQLEVTAKIERLPLAGLPFVCERARGELSSTLRVQDLLGNAPRATLELGVLGFSLGSEQGLDLKAQLAVDPQQLVAQGSLTAQGHTSTFELRSPVSVQGLSSAPARDAAIEGKLALQALPLAALVPRQGPLSHVSGTATGSVQLKGSVGAPRLSGELKIQEAGFTATALAQPLSDIDGEISFADDVILLKQLSAKDGDGTLGIDGRVKIESGTFDGTFNLAAHKFPLRQAGQVMATTSANAQIQALWSPTVRDLRFQLRDFDTWLEGVQATSGLALEAHPDVVVDDPATRIATAGEGEGDGSSTDSEATKLIVRIDAGQQFWVRRADFAIKLSANLEIVVDEKSATPESAVSVKGQLQFDRGYLELLGRVFDLERGGTLRFTGGTEAIIDLSATYLDRRSEKTVKVQISGSATSPQLEFFLEGARINAGEAFTAIYGTETSSSDEIEDTEAQAKQFVSALTAGMIATTLRRNLGAMAPIVMVTPGDSQSSGQLRAGFEADALIPEFMRGVVTGVYLEGILSSDNTAANGSSQRDVQRGVSIDVHFPHNLVTSGRYGPDTTWSLDFGWQP